MTDRCNQSDYGAKKGEKVGKITLPVGIHNKPYFEGDEILPKEMGHFYGRTFKWDSLVDRLFDHHQVIKKQKAEGLAGEEGKPICFNMAMVKQLLHQQKDPRPSKGNRGVHARRVSGRTDAADCQASD